MQNSIQNSAILKVRRDTMRPKYWRLLWETPGSNTFCYAEGECSAIYYSTMRAAIAGGIRRFDIIAIKADF